MKIAKWTAEISMLVFEGTDSVRQTFSASGGGVEPEALPKAIAANVAKAMLLLGDKSAETKQIADLEEQLEALKKRASLLQEAATLVPDAGEAEPQLPVEAPKPKPKPPRR